MNVKRMASLVLAVLIALPLPAFADSKTGTITEWDGANHTVTIKHADGKSASFGWSGKTKVHGIAKLGERVTISYTTDADGKAWAMLITVEEQPAPAPPKPAK